MKVEGWVLKFVAGYLLIGIAVLVVLAAGTLVWGEVKTIKGHVKHDFSDWFPKDWQQDMLVFFYMLYVIVNWPLIIGEIIVALFKKGD